MTPITSGLIGFVLLIVLMFARIPVGFVMALVGFLGFGLLTSWGASLNLIARDFFSVFRMAELLSSKMNRNIGFLIIQRQKMIFDYHEHRLK